MTAEAQILTELKEMRAQMNVLTKAVMEGIPEWVTIQKACELKGVKIKTINSDKRLQPRFGIPDKTMGRRKYWTRASILEWLKVLNYDDIQQYAKAHPIEFKMI